MGGGGAPLLIPLALRAQLGVPEVMDAQRGEFCGIRRRRPGLEIQRQAKGVGDFLHSRGREGADRRTSLSPKWPTNQVVTSSVNATALNLIKWWPK